MTVSDDDLRAWARAYTTQRADGGFQAAFTDWLTEVGWQAFEVGEPAYVWRWGETVTGQPVVAVGRRNLFLLTYRSAHSTVEKHPRYENVSDEAAAWRLRNTAEAVRRDMEASEPCLLWGHNFDRDRRCRVCFKSAMEVHGRAADA